MSTMNPSHSATIPLHLVPAGSRAVIQEVQGGRGILSRLAPLGFTPGACLTMVQNFGHGPLIVAIREARIALGRGEAGKIRVVVEKRAGAPREPQMMAEEQGDA